MTDRDRAVEHFAEAVSAHYSPAARRAQNIERLASAVADVFAAAERDRPGQARQLELADRVTQARALRQRAEARYGPAVELYDRLTAHGSALSARVWC